MSDIIYKFPLEQKYFSVENSGGHRAPIKNFFINYRKIMMGLLEIYKNNLSPVFKSHKKIGLEGPSYPNLPSI